MKCDNAFSFSKKKNFYIVCGSEKITKLFFFKRLHLRYFFFFFFLFIQLKGQDALYTIDNYKNTLGGIVIKSPMRITRRKAHIGIGAQLGEYPLRK